MKKVLNASIARIVLSLLLLIILSAMVGLVIFAYSFLSKTSEEVGKMQTEAIAVDAKIQSLLASKSQLDRNSDTVKKAKNIVSESKLYQYQNQIIQDLIPTPTALAFRLKLSLSKTNQQLPLRQRNLASKHPPAPLE